VDDSSGFTEGELRLLGALSRRGVRFMVVGLGAAALQGANLSTQDIDLWFEDLSDPRIAEAAREVGAVWVPGSFGMMPPQLGGDAVGARLDVVTHMTGLGKFGEELANTRELVIAGLPLRILDLRRILESKRATGRTKDIAAIPALEEAIAAVEATEGGTGVQRR
jgi:hypothetical protein